VSGPAIPGMFIHQMVQIGDKLTFEPTGDWGILVDWNPAAGSYTLLCGPSLWKAEISLQGFGAWWSVERGGEVIKRATHDPVAIRLGILKLKEDRGG